MPLQYCRKNASDLEDVIYIKTDAKFDFLHTYIMFYLNMTWSMFLEVVFKFLCHNDYLYL